jgi:hypothetical protein
VFHQQIFLKIVAGFLSNLPFFVMRMQSINFRKPFYFLIVYILFSFFLLTGISLQTGRLELFSLVFYRSLFCSLQSFNCLSSVSSTGQLQGELQNKELGSRGLQKVL